MKLGTASQIAIGTKDVDTSAIVYDKLGFRKLNQGALPNPFIQYTDDSSLILLNQDNMEYMGFIYFQKDMQLVAQALKQAGTQFLQENNDASGNFFQGIFMTPDGVLINLVNFDPGAMYQPKKNLLHFTEEEILDTTKYPNPRIGLFGEFSVPVKDLQTSLAYWKLIGFEAMSVNAQPYPWAIVTDGINVLGLHQTNEFDHQAITYFAPDMKSRIENLRNAGLDDNLDPFRGTGGGEKNAVLTTMEGQKFFLFSF